MRALVQRPHDGCCSETYHNRLYVSISLSLSPCDLLPIVRYVSFEDLMSLLNDVHKTNSGPIEKALRDADIARMGQV